MSDTKEKETPIIEEEKLNDQMKVRREKMQEFIPSVRNTTGIIMHRKSRMTLQNWKKMKPSSVSPAASWLSAATARRLSASFAI